MGKEGDFLVIGPKHIFVESITKINNFTTSVETSNVIIFYLGTRLNPKIK